MPAFHWCEAEMLRPLPPPAGVIGLRWLYLAVSYPALASHRIQSESRHRTAGIALAALSRHG
jgi:hypothetical protein